LYFKCRTDCASFLPDKLAPKNKSLNFTPKEWAGGR